MKNLDQYSTNIMVNIFFAERSKISPQNEKLNE